MASAFYNYLHSSVYRIKDSIKGTGVYKWLDTLMLEQTLGPVKMEGIQSRRLRDIIIHARNHSPYYRKLFEERGIKIDDDFNISRLKDLPLLRREDLQNNYKNILCGDAGEVYPNSSGGSTGNPVNFYQDESYKSFSQAANLLFLNWMGIRSGDKSAAVWGADRDFKDLSLRDKFWIKFDRVKGLNAFSMSDEQIARFLAELNRFKPRLVYGYASALYLVAKYINSAEPLKYAPTAVRSSAEMLYDFQRQEIEKAFGTRVYDFYGSREINNLTGECSMHEGMHILSSGRIVEIVDDEGRPVADGIGGQIAVTDLTNFAFPFVRYLNGDMAVKSTSRCSCGRGYPLIEKIQGRTSDVIVVDGQFIHGEFFTHLFYNKPEIIQFQLIQEDARRLRLIVVSREENPNLDDVIAGIRKKVGAQVNIEIEFTDHIPPTASGKHRFTISRLKK